MHLAFVELVSVYQLFFANEASFEVIKCYNHFNLLIGYFFLNINLNMKEFLSDRLWFMRKFIRTMLSKSKSVV